MNGIVIGTKPDRTDQLKNCLNSLSGCKYDLYVFNSDGYEIGKIKFALTNTKLDEFIFIQDSIEIKNIKLFDLCFSYHGSVSICNYPKLFGCYLGKYKRSVLDQMNLPTISTKKESVAYESRIGAEYSLIEKPLELFDDLGNDNGKLDNKWGRKVLKIENDYLIKYKTYWNLDQL